MKKILSIALVSVIPFFTLAQNKDLKKLNSTQIKTETVKEYSSDSDLNILTKGDKFVDAAGRTMFLRGINLGGSSKMPFTPYVVSHVREGFYNGEELSFVGRPFPLDEADKHFSRLKEWGFHFLRFIVTWEAIEHKGPRIYDEEYLDYLHAIISKANEYGMNVMIDPHQDLWSRYTGGDGAPKWTFEVAGMNVENLDETGAAFNHNIYGDPYPKMIWFSNYFKLGSSTMFTLFFGGNDFAPNLMVEGQNIQDYLQSHYIKSIAKVAKKLSDLPNVVGFELMNEPSAGYIGIPDINAPYETEILGTVPTPIESMMLGAGQSLEIQKYRLGVFTIKNDGKKIVNKNKILAWQSKEQCLWKNEGVWNIDKSGKLTVKNNYFNINAQGDTVDFNRDYYEPFADLFAKEIQKINKDWFICVDNVLFPYPNELPNLKKSKVNANWINGSHWYDDVTLLKKKYMPYLGVLPEEGIIVGSRKVRKAYERFLAKMITDTKKYYGNVPSLLGEFGIPYDMNKAKAYRMNNFKSQEKAMNRSMQLTETNLLNYTLWNYTADNTNERGDQWNGEDLSVFSLSQQTDKNDINSGGRALKAVVRPYPKAIAGELLSYHYDYKKEELTVVFNADAKIDAPSEIHLPHYIYNNKFNVEFTDGDLSYDKENAILMYYPKTAGTHTIVVKK
jgi:hypothetical protein